MFGVLKELRRYAADVPPTWPSELAAADVENVPSHEEFYSVTRFVFR